MQTLYHVDTTGRLATGMTIDLNPNKLSFFGNDYRSQFARAGVLDALVAGTEHKNLMLLSSAAYREYFLEMFRIHNPRIKELKLPSRLSSFFAVKTVDAALGYLERNDVKGNPTIFSVYCDGPLTELDMTWLDQQFPRDINAFLYYYEHYWNGSHICNDVQLASHEVRGSFIEVLISTPVTIGPPVIVEGIAVQSNNSFNPTPLCGAA